MWNIKAKVTNVWILCLWPFGQQERTEQIGDLSKSRKQQYVWFGNI